MALYITGILKFDLHLCRRQPVTDWAREVARVSVLPNEAAEGGCCPGGPSAGRARRQPRAGRLVERHNRHRGPGADTCAYSTQPELAGLMPGSAPYCMCQDEVNSVLPGPMVMSGRGRARGAPRPASARRDRNRACALDWDGVAGSAVPSFPPRPSLAHSWCDWQVRCPVRHGGAGTPILP